jgi:hypothetical protein
MRVGLLVQFVRNLDQLFGFRPQLRCFLELLARCLLVDLSHCRGLLCVHDCPLCSSRASLTEEQLSCQAELARHSYGLATLSHLLVATVLLAVSRENQMLKTATQRVTARPPGKAPRGRPRVHREAWAKVSVVLFERQVKSLDRLTRDVRRKSGRAMTRAEIIRALIDGLIVSGIRLTDHGSEAALRSHIASRLTSGSGRRGRS